MDVQLIALILLVAAALFVLWINAAALRSFSRQIEGQREDARAIHSGQRDLEHRLHRLAAAIDQSREQLHRALELASAVHLLLYARLRDPLKDISEEDAGKIHTYLIELKAIAVVNGDTEFIDLVGRLRVAVDYLLNPPDDPGTVRPNLNVSEATGSVQRKVYDLLAAATRN